MLLSWPRRVVLAWSWVVLLHTRNRVYILYFPFEAKESVASLLPGGDRQCTYYLLRLWAMRTNPFGWLRVFFVALRERCIGQIAPFIINRFFVRKGVDRRRNW